MSGSKATRAVDRVRSFSESVEGRTLRTAEALGDIPGSGGVAIVAIATVLVVAIETYLAVLPETPQPGEQTRVTPPELLANLQAHGVERVLGSGPEIAVTSLIIYGVVKWYDAGQPVPDALERAINRGAEWPHWWIAVPIGAAPEVALVVPIYGYALWRYAHGATGPQVKAELTTWIETVVVPAAKAHPRLVLFLFPIGIMLYLAWSYLLMPVAIYLDVKHVERNTYASFSWRDIVSIALVSRTFAILRYFRRRRQAVGGWYVDEVVVEARAHRAAEGIQ